MLHKALILAALAAVLARGGSAAENTDWFHDAKWGVIPITSAPCRVPPAERN